jgi:hypothetical protein
MAELWLLISAPPICPRSNSSVSPAHSPLKMCDLDSIPLAEHYWHRTYNHTEFPATPQAACPHAASQGFFNSLLGVGDDLI